MGVAADGCKSGETLRVGLPGLKGGDLGGPAVPHHLQRGGECGGEELGWGDGRGRGRAGQARTVGNTPKSSLLRGL